MRYSEDVHELSALFFINFVHVKVEDVEIKVEEREKEDANQG